MKLRPYTDAFILLAASTIAYAYAYFYFGGVSWKEEVQLHDGSKIIVERTLSHGGRHELTQRLPIKEHDITFTVPGTKKSITWKDEYEESWGYSNFNLLALHILNGTPYIIASPELCLSYNKWGRPNPPYVIFKHDGNAWQRIQMAELPKEFETINLVVFIMSLEKKLVAQSPVPASLAKEFNSGLPYKEYKSILRTPLAANDLCPPPHNSFKAQ